MSMGPDSSLFDHFVASIWVPVPRVAPEACQPCIEVMETKGDETVVLLSVGVIFFLRRATAHTISCAAMLLNTHNQNKYLKCEITISNLVTEMSRERGSEFL